MNGTDNDRSSADEIEFHSAGVLVNGQGYWTEAALARFRHYLKLRRFSPSEVELRHALQRAKESYWQGDACLYICAAQPCCGRTSLELSAESLDRLSKEIGLPIARTGCQGPCKLAPVVALRIGDRQEMFVQAASDKDWRALFNYAKAAKNAGTLLVDDGAMAKFRFDPVHDHGHPSAQMKPLEFLLGHFRGEGRYAMSDYRFHKEVIGSFEAGGRFIALRMDASYPLPDGRKDNHRAFVVVGAEPSGDITAHAYTDGGLMVRYAIDRADGALAFADTPPGHASEWKRARKILRPTRDGFEERLEVDPGDGFVPYYVISMQRIGARSGGRKTSPT